MLTKLLIIFCAIAYGSSAPSCIDLCSPSLNARTSESLTAYGTHSSLAQQQSTLRELHQSLTDQLESSRLNVNFGHPGNWTDHKDYRTPDGTGQVHEEAGQLVNGGAQIRYYKKNYAASYGTGSNNLGLGHNLESESLLQDDLLHSRNLGQSLQNYGHEQSRLDSSRLQESTNTQLHNDRVNSANNDNWSRFNTYGVDGGRGKVYEEEGQYTHGPAKVRYYKKNYTSSYSSSGGETPSVLPIIPQLTNLESQAQQLESHLNQLSRDSHHSQSIHSDNSARQSEYGQVYHQNNYPQHYDRPISTEQRYEQASRQEQTVRGSGYVPVQPVTHFNYVVPETELGTVGTSQLTSQQTLQTQHTHRAQVDDTHHNQQVGGIVRVPLHRNDYGSNVNTYREDSRREEILAAEQALRNQLRDNIQYEPVQVVQTLPGRRVEEHWESNSRHRVESTIPHHIETVPIRGDLATHQRISQGSGLDYSNQATQGSGGSSSSYQHHEQFGSSGSYQVGHQAADCDTLGEGQVGQYTRRHKRDVEFAQQRENLGGYPNSGYGRQSHEVYQDNDRHRHYGNNYEQNSRIGDYNYQNRDDDHHRHHGQDYGQHIQERRNEYSGYEQQSYEQQSHRDDDRHRHYGQDYSQRFRREEYHHQDHDHKSHEGHPHHDDDQHRHLSRDNDDDRDEDHSHNHQSHEGHPHKDDDDDRRRHSGGEPRYKRESKRYEDFDQQTDVGFGDLSQHSADFDFGQSTEKLTLEKQKKENLNQETQGIDFWHKQANLEFGQQTEDLSQQTQKFDDLSHHQLSGHNFDHRHHKLETGNLEFGQQTEDLSQQTQKFDDLSHHQAGFHELGQHNHKLETGNLEFGQQTEDLSQQTHTFDFGQQTEDLSQQTHKFDFGQQTEDLSQQTHNFDDLSHHHHKLETGNLELGQQTEDLSQQTHKYNFGQQTEDLSQQTHNFDDLSHHHHKLETGNLELGQQIEDLSQQTHKYDFGQQTEDLSQQTHNFDDLSHHHHKLETGNLELGQQIEDLSQQTHAFDLNQHQAGTHELSQHNHKLETGNLEFGQQTEDLSQQTHKFDFGQQTEDLSQQTHTFDLNQHQAGTHELDQHNHKLETGNLEFGQQTEDLSQQTHKFDDFSQHQSERHEFAQHHNQLHTDNLELGQQTEDLSQQIHKIEKFSQHNQLPTGRIEFGQSNPQFGHRYPQVGISPPTNYPREFKPAPKPTPRPLRIGNQRSDIEPELVGPEGPVSSVKPVSPVRPVKGGRAYTPRVLPAQYQSAVPSTGVLSLEEQSLAQESGSSWHQSHHPGDLTSGNQEQQSQVDSATLESRILQVYGGKSPYEAGIQGDYSGVKPNPSATLEPQYYGNEPWEIREVASDKFSARSAAPLDTVPESTTLLPETTPAPGFWKKLGSKITTSYEKAKDKLSTTFG